MPDSLHDLGRRSRVEVNISGATEMPSLETKPHAVQQDEPVLYRSRFVSGWSPQTLLTRIMRVNNGLEVIMTTHSIRVDANPICYVFRPIFRALGLVREIHTADILTVNTQWQCILTRFEITFLDESRQQRTIILVPWNAHRFHDAIEQVRSQFRQRDDL